MSFNAVYIAVAILAIFAIVCVVYGPELWREDPEELDESGAPEGGRPTVRMPRFR